MASDDDSDERSAIDGVGEREPSTDSSAGSSADPSAGSSGVAAGAVQEVDGRIVDLLAWVLDTETRAKIYIFLLANPGSTSEEIAKGTGLYPSTVREALAELHDEERVSREKRASEGAGNNPYAYTAIQPSELVGGVVDQVQRELNTIFTLDRVLDRGDGGGDGDAAEGTTVEPVTITVEGDDVASAGANGDPVDDLDADDADLDTGTGDDDIDGP